MVNLRLPLPRINGHEQGLAGRATAKEYPSNTNRVTSSYNPISVFWRNISTSCDEISDKTDEIYCVRPSSLVDGGPHNASLPLLSLPRCDARTADARVEIICIEENSRTGPLLGNQQRDLQPFPVPKPNGKIRPILDLSRLNTSINKITFTMESLQRLIPLIPNHSYFAKIDLKDAFYHVLINQEDRCHLRFIAPDGSHWQYRAMPFGYSRAPWIFTTMLKSILAHLRRWIHMNLYMDDLLIWNKNPFILSIQVKAVLDRLKEFKCQVNWEKSILIPTQSIEYLGIILNTRKENLQLEITKQKWKSIKNQCKLKNVHSPKHLASIIGTLNFYRIVTPDLRLVMRPLERWLTAELRANKGNY